MFPRTFGLVALCTLCMIGIATADTRISASGGISGIGSVSDVLEWSSPYLQVTVNAPTVLHHRLPLEFVVAAEGPFSNSLIVDADTPGSPHWSRAFGTEAILRMFASASNYPLEPGVGIAYYQFRPYVNAERYESYCQSMPIQTQWRWDVFLRVNILPSRSSGPLLEVEAQHVFDESKQGDMPLGAILAKLGWRFRV